MYTENGVTRPGRAPDSLYDSAARTLMWNKFGQTQYTDEDVSKKLASLTVDEVAKIHQMGPKRLRALYDHFNARSIADGYLNELLIGGKGKASFNTRSKVETAYDKDAEIVSLLAIRLCLNAIDKEVNSTGFFTLDDYHPMEYIEMARAQLLGK